MFLFMTFFLGIFFGQSLPLPTVVTSTLSIFKSRHAKQHLALYFEEVNVVLGHAELLQLFPVP